MSRIPLDEYYLRTLQLLAQRSTCIRRKVACIITTENGVVLSTGYNGVPRGIFHCLEAPCAGANDPPGDTNRCLAVHAEQNAMLQCTQLDKAHTMYVTCTPCFTCAKMIANTNVRVVICLEHYADERAADVFNQSGITLKYGQASTT